MSDRPITVREGLDIVGEWLDHHFPDEQRGYLPAEGRQPHLWRVMPSRRGPGFRLAVHEDLLQRAGMLRDRLRTLEQGTSAQAPGRWVVLSTRGIER